VLASERPLILVMERLTSVHPYCEEWSTWWRFGLLLTVQCKAWVGFMVANVFCMQ
jgi:hypothetical protein